MAERLVFRYLGAVTVTPHWREFVDEVRGEETVSGAQSQLPPCPADTNVRWHNCFGSFSTSDGLKYIGEFRNGKMHGRGTLTYGDGGEGAAKYVGEFRDDKMHGEGTLTYGDGGEYVGEFRDDKPLGPAQSDEIGFKRFDAGSHWISVKVLGWALSALFLAWLLALKVTKGKGGELRQWVWISWPTMCAFFVFVLVKDGNYVGTSSSCVAEAEFSSANERFSVRSIASLRPGECVVFSIDDSEWIGPDSVGMYRTAEIRTDELLLILDPSHPSYEISKNVRLADRFQFFIRPETNEGGCRALGRAQLLSQDSATPRLFRTESEAIKSPDFPEARLMQAYDGWICETTFGLEIEVKFRADLLPSDSAVSAMRQYGQCQETRYGGCVLTEDFRKMRILTSGAQDSRSKTRPYTYNPGSNSSIAAGMCDAGRQVLRAAIDLREQRVPIAHAERVAESLYRVDVRLYRFVMASISATYTSPGSIDLELDDRWLRECTRFVQGH